MSLETDKYPVIYAIEYPEKVDRLTAFFRLLWSVPIIIVLCLLTSSNGSAAAGLFPATALLILFRQSYPRWWFDFALELNRFSTRVGAYVLLLTDYYPSTVDKQSVTLDIPYPNVRADLSRWLPLVKWLLAFPHYIVLALLITASVLVTVVAWFAVLVTGNYPRTLFTFVVGVGRWCMRVNAYAFLLTTDKYPPFSLS